MQRIMNLKWRIDKKKGHQTKENKYCYYCYHWESDGGREWMRINYKEGEMHDNCCESVDVKDKDRKKRFYYLSWSLA